MKRRAFSLFLALALLLSLLPGASAEDIELVSTDDIQLAELPTAETEASNVQTKLAAVLQSYPDGSAWNESYDGAVQCYGFAGLVVNRVFGSTSSGAHRWWTYAGENLAGMVLVDQVSNCTEATVLAMLAKARPGDVLQFDRGPNGHQHSMIVYDITRSGNVITGATIYECNWYSNCQVSLRSLTNLQIALRQACGDGTMRAKLSLLSSDNWEAVNGGPYQPGGGTEPEPSTLALSGAVFPSGHYNRLSSFDLKGTFTSNYTITRVEASITDSLGKTVMVYDTPWAKTKYNIQSDGLNYAFLFGSLGDDAYTFRVAATDSSGKIVEAGSSFDIGKTVSTEAPVLSFSSSTAGLALKWTAVSGAGYYQLQREYAGVWETLSNPEQPAYTDSAIAMGSSCSYRVRAHLSNGWTAFSEELEILFNPFCDVPNSGRTLEYVSWAYNEGIVSGTSAYAFSPNNRCTRIQFVMMLWKMHGSPEVSGTNPFSDISGTKTTRAILWALKKGIINSGRTFDPDGSISREQIVMILYKLAGSPSVSGTNPFTDVSGSKTVKAVLWAYQNGITKGTSATTFAPTADCTRVQLVIFLYKYNNIYQVI